MPNRRTFLTWSASAGLAAVSGCSALTAPTVTVAVPWSGRELKAFRAVLNGLDPPDPYYRVELVPLGDDIAAAFDQHPYSRPDVVLLPQPGLVDRHLGQLKPLDDPPSRYGAVWESLLRRGGQWYGIPFKFTHKSVVWYRRSVFERLGRPAPERWYEWLELNESLAGDVPPLALAGADGWALTDFFENVLAGWAPDVYDKLAPGPDRRPLHDSPAVETALRHLGTMWAAENALCGGVAGSLVRQFADAVVQVFVYKRAAMVVAPDFAELVVRQFTRDLDDVGVFPFPKVASGAKRPLVVGGDVAVVTEGASKHASDLVSRLAAPGAPLPWIAEFGGFLAANEETNEDAEAGYTEQLSELDKDLRGGQNLRFDLSDRLDAVGGSGGLGRVLQDFLARVGGRGGRVDLREEARLVMDRLRGLEG